MTKIILIVYCLISVSSVLAEEVCVEVKSDNVPRNMRQALAYRLTYNAGETQIPTGLQGVPLYSEVSDNICMSDPSIDLKSILTPITMKEAYDNFKRESEETLEGIRQLKQELDGLNSRIASDYSALGSASLLETRDILKREIRRNQIKKDIGIR